MRTVKKAVILMSFINFERGGILATMKKYQIVALLSVFVWTAVIALFPGIGLAGIKAIDPVHGPAKIKGEDVSYYHCKIKLAADSESSVVFKQGTCLLSDQKGNKYPDCWIHVAGGSAGLSVSQQAPINMKTLALEFEDHRAPGAVQWNTSMVSGPKGALEFKIPKGGHVVLNFLWEVPKGFAPGRIQIGDIFDVSFKK